MLKLSNRMNENNFITTSVKKTQKIAEVLAGKLVPGDFLAFYGDLGSGKTTFIQGLAKALGINRRIISPTFIIVRTYDLKSENKSFKQFYHIDLYRTSTVNDLLGIGLDQVIKDKSSIVALEWAEKMGDLLPQKRYEVHMSNEGDDKRKIKILKYG